MPDLQAVPTATDEEYEQYARDRPSLPYYVRALLRATLRQVEEALAAERAKVARVEAEIHEWVRYGVVSAEHGQRLINRIADCAALADQPEQDRRAP